MISLKKIGAILFSLMVVLATSCSDDEEERMPEPPAPEPPVLDTLPRLVQEVAGIGLPVVVVETVDGEEPTADFVRTPDGNSRTILNPTKVPGRIYVVEDSTVVYDSGPYEHKQSGMTIKLRGNWTSWEDKKPYKIKLQVKGDMMSRGDTRFDDRDWVLIKENTLKAMIGLWVNELVGLPWTPAMKRVNLVFNNDYRGVYLLIEAVGRNADCRLNVDKQTGYIVEMDGYYWKEDLFFSTQRDKHYTFKYPDDDKVTPSQIDYIQSYIARLENDLPPFGRGNDYDRLIDVDSWAAWLLGHDILGTRDAGGSNIFMTKYDDSDTTKLMMGNMWDFDSIFGMDDQPAKVRTETWYYAYPMFELAANDALKRTYVRHWREVGQTIYDELLQRLSYFGLSPEAAAFDSSLVCEQARWNTSFHSTAEYTRKARTYLTHRSEWLSAYMDSLEATLTSIP